MKLVGVLMRLHRAVDKAGSLKALATQWHVSESYLCDVRKRKRLPGPSILRPMGLMAILIYETTQKKGP